MMGRSSMGSQLYGDRVKKMAKGSKLKMVKGPSGNVPWRWLLHEG